MPEVLFSFDIEEFDMPLEYGKKISFDQQIRVSDEGTSIILDILKNHEVKATFFSTATYAIHSGNIINRLCKEGHELASHSYFHSQFEHSHLLASKEKLEEISGQRVDGFRMPRMMPVNEDEIRDAGYKYNSSLNPTYIPGRYNNLSKSRRLFKNGELIHLPASVTPTFRIPLFWLSFHNFPLWFYMQACSNTMARDGYVNLYFHPWEFTDLTLSDYGFPNFVSKNSGIKMIERFEKLILWMKGQGFSFSTINHFLKNR